LVVVEVVQEHVQCPHPLNGAFGQTLPFRGGKDAGDDVEGYQPLGAGLFAIHIEGDADAAKQQFRFVPALPQLFAGYSGKPLGISRIQVAHFACRSVHFVECADCCQLIHIADDARSMPAKLQD
jgi:hypothetical protein